MDEHISLEEIGTRAKLAARAAGRLNSGDKNAALRLAADALTAGTAEILAENEKDVNEAKASGIKGAFIDRLSLTEARVRGMAEGLIHVAGLDDPIGEALSMKTLPNGLAVAQKRVPLGVIAIIYEARPNVTSDAFGLCLKAGSACVLRGGKEALRSNKAIVSVIREALEKNGYGADALQLVTDASRETASALMRLNKYVDVLIPRGGAGLIKSVVENSTIPVIETGVGNCHIFVDESADFAMAERIIVNAKTQRPGVCNACEKIIIHKNIAADFLPMICAALRARGVEIRGDKRAVSLNPEIIPANEDDWYAEYADLIIAAAIADDLDAAIDHISKYSSGHSEAIITESYGNSQRFLNEIDSAAVYVNASTRFTDGGEFGLGAEIGISTQKLHARGPMGLKEMTTTKYVIFGSGQIRQ